MQVSALLLWSFFISNILISFYIIRKNYLKKCHLEYATQKLQEKLNILNEENLRELKNNASLKAKIIRYNSLKKVVDEINASLNLDSVGDNVTQISFSVISNNKGVCLLYLVDGKTHKLGLFKVKKEDEKLIIKAKEGDIFDFWVLRHVTPLLIEDIRKDFRFDLEKLKDQDLRPVSSLISSSLMSESRFLGILRLDSPEPNFYSQEDLRYLVTVCDLAAIALQNCQLFEYTQDLAIHDGLTQLYTKGYFLERLKEECIRGSRHKSVFSLFMLDIDFFKNFNDKFGHIAGDIILKKISQNIIDSLKGYNPIVCRFGGEEFCVLLPGIDNKKAYTVASALRERIEKEKTVLRRQETNITASIGLATFPRDAQDAGELIRLADSAMYQAKQKGRNKVCCI
jgi:diguanylate cyclase (GGDEF)-like protein